MVQEWLKNNTINCKLKRPSQNSKNDEERNLYNMIKRAKTGSEFYLECVRLGLKD